MVCVAFIAGGINAQSASIAKKNGGTSAYVEHLASAAGETLVSLLLLAASPWYRSSYWRLQLKNRPLVKFVTVEGPLYKLFT